MIGYSGKRWVLGSLVVYLYREAQCLASRDLESSSYEAVGELSRSVATSRRNRRRSSKLDMQGFRLVH